MIVAIFQYGITHDITQTVKPTSYFSGWKHPISTKTSSILQALMACLDVFDAKDFDWAGPRSGAAGTSATNVWMGYLFVIMRKKWDLLVGESKGALWFAWNTMRSSLSSVSLLNNDSKVDTFVVSQNFHRWQEEVWKKVICARGITGKKVQSQGNH